MRENKKFRMPFIGILLSVIAVFALLSFSKIVSHAAEGDYLTFTAEEDSTIQFKWLEGSDVQISYDNGATWKNYEPDAVINLDAGKSVSFKAFNVKTDYHSSTCRNGYNNFIIEGKVAASGDVTSLTNGVGGDCQLSDACYYGMFESCDLTSSPNLPSTTLEVNCYYGMFANCRLLTACPELPATFATESCYEFMFYGCISLTACPKLPAATLADDCYYGMFVGCSSLVYAPQLPVTSLAVGCYAGMFDGCSSLLTAPELPATSLTDYCYFRMFYNCSSLISTPDLPATSLADSCYYQMFYRCKNITSISNLPATSLADSCYYEMFSYCRSLIIQSSGSGIKWSIPQGSTPASKWNYNMFYYSSSESDVVSPSIGATYYIVSDQTPSPVQQFVTRLYEVCLDREPDEDGLKYWSNALADGSKTGVQVASGFILSTEFCNHNYCNSCFVEHLYQAFMGRASDEGGKANWISSLETGTKREEVFNGFALSDEFKNICDQYGIIQGIAIDIPEYGTIPKGPCSADGTLDGVTSFVTRLYNVCLDRDPDEAGLNDWTNKLWNHETSGSSTAHGFIFSQEFINKNLNNEDYVEYLYKAIFGRASDEAGKADWVSKLNAGTSREDVFNGFAGSQEFTNLCAKYGIVR